MDLFDLGGGMQEATLKRREENSGRLNIPADQLPTAGANDVCNLTVPDTPYEEKETSSADIMSSSPSPTQSTSAVSNDPPEDLVKGLMPLRDTPTLVLGVASDILFPAFQQREIAETLRRAGNRSVTHVELGEDRSLFGHDTFLLDLEGVGGEIKRFLG
jgi:homoserine acetyltransferase